MSTDVNAAQHQPTYRLDNNGRLVDAAFDPLDTKANTSRASSQAYIDQHAHCACGAWLDGRNLYVSAVTKAGKVTLVCWRCEAMRRGVPPV